VYFDSIRIGIRTRDKFKDRNESGDKFKDYYMHFKSIETGMRTQDKFLSCIMFRSFVNFIFPDHASTSLQVSMRAG